MQTEMLITSLKIVKYQWDVDNKKGIFKKSRSQWEDQGANAIEAVNWAKRKETAAVEKYCWGEIQGSASEEKKL